MKRSLLRGGATLLAMKRSLLRGGATLLVMKRTLYANKYLARTNIDERFIGGPGVRGLEAVRGRSVTSTWEEHDGKLAEAERRRVVMRRAMRGRRRRRVPGRPGEPARVARSAFPAWRRARACQPHAAAAQRCCAACGRLQG